MKKRIFAMLLSMAVMLSMAAFVSCGGEEEDEDLGELIELTVTVSVTGNDGNVLINSLPVPLEGYAKNLTVLEATIRAIEASDIEHEEDGGFITRIGDYGIIRDAKISDDEEDEENEEPVEEAAEEPAEDDETDYVWVFLVNGREGGGARNTELNDGDVIEWRFVDSGLELE
ncbi:MAG: DUF4430 domain-containing protein [Oscillospiraceae bacterium]|nr:DUF4430 domain-containing protein [Oscillospiraceae bacterium]